ncbi:hypothetical protein BJF81_11060 [Ornithinimicrobium sp. CNJ-824]|uniref:hypothetical protein n=1 Tax=Ornithinimicrobium sp. CNJ-824 TaxID=1904966 RepID=UPI00095D52D7|nr:hypothetical protein [Ornithinimicrobium sp. CNJ-824]OLT23439.1 hypothetical protein BJF81_11060 [Ornithinimicrobium sp. CNJ-824]
MSTVSGTTDDVVVAEPRVSTAWTVARWFTLAAFVVTVVALVLTGTREASYADLQRSLESGSVTHVRVEGGLEQFPGAGDQVQGVTTVRLVWEQGWETRAATVRQASSQSELDAQATGVPHSGAVVGPVADELARHFPDVEVTYATRTGPGRRGARGA